MSRKVAIIGSGVAGLGCAWNLRDCAEIEIYERDSRPGGHTNTVEVRTPSGPLRVDTGFIVFNKVTYPNLCALFDELGVAAQPSEMSFSVQHLASGLEYNGMGPAKLFAQKRNLLNPRFWRLLADIFRFFKVARASLEENEEISLRDFVERHRLGRDFLDFYLVPMSSAVWSTEPGDILGFPAITLARFFYNHGFLGVTTHHPWFTVAGGSRTYMDKILARVGPPRLSAPAVGVAEGTDGARVRFADGSEKLFDRVILACHADQALAMLEAADEAQSKALSPFRYQHNRAVLHTWEGVMPKKRIAWASWNYRVADARATTHYWMNALQKLPVPTNYFVSLNSEIPAEHVVYETDYEHPVFTLDAVRAQKTLPALNARTRGQRVFFCGSYFKYGFHEDAYSSALYLSRILKERLRGD